MVSTSAPACVVRTYVATGGIPLARPNFKYEKRQKELAKQKKAEDKRLRRMEKRNDATGDEPTETVADDVSSEEPTEPTPGDATNE